MNALIKKWRSIPASAKSSIAFIISSFFLKGISFITTPIFTRLMDPTQYGIMATYTSWTSIIDVFALLGLTSAGVFNVGLNDHRDTRNQYISSTLTLCNLTTLIVFAVIAVCKIVIGESFLLPTNLLVLMFLHFIFSPAQVFWITRQKYEYKYKLAFIITIASTLVSQAVSILGVFVNTTGHDAYVKLWCAELSSFLFVIPLYVLTFVRGKTFFNRHRWKQTLVFALPLIPHYLAQHVMSGADRIMLSNMVGSSSAGIYSVVANISMIATIVWGAINASLVAYVFEHLAKKEYKPINSTVSLLVLGYGITCVAVCLVAPEVLRILAPAEYYVGVYAVPPIAGAAFLSALYNVYANIEFFHKESIYITTATITATVINLVLNYVFIRLFPAYGFIAAVYTTLISYAVLVLMHFIGYRKSTPEKIYNDRNLFVICFVCIGACVGCTLLYPSTVVRYGLVGTLLILAVWKRKFILEKIKALRS